MTDYYMNNLSSGGQTLGTVSTIEASSRAVGCATGTHLHQEAGGSAYNYARYWGEGVAARSSDIEYVLMSGIVGTAPTDR